MARRRVAFQPSHIGALCSVGFVESTEASGLKWIQCCVEGTFLGHPKFPRIDWTEQVFDTLIANLRKHPGFVAGPDGVGAARVVPWDYEHANEYRRMSGDIPAEGLPAASWTYDLKKQKGADGRWELWALTEWLPRAREQIIAGEYQGCSVCVQPKFIDPVSGKDQGPTLTSIALTNDPFVQGMAPLAATLEQYGPAESPLEVLVGIRSALELPEDATAQVAIEQLQALQAAIATGTVPEYVEEGYLLDRIRRLLKLPLLATPESILGGAIAALEQLPTGEGTAPPISTPTQENPMPQMQTAVLAAILGCADNEPAILQAMKESAKKAETAEANQAASGALEQLKTLFGSKDIDDLLAAATKTIADAKTLEPTIATLNEMRNALKAGAEEDAKAEAEAVAASMSGGDASLAARFKPVILAARTACIDEKTGRVDAAKLDKFRADYPLPEEQKALLTRRVIAGPNGSQLGGAVTGYQTQPITQTAGGVPAAGGSPDAKVQKLVEELNAQSGRNPVEKANALLCSRSEGHKSLPYAEQIRRAGEVSRALQNGKVPAGLTA